MAAEEVFRATEGSGSDVTSKCTLQSPDSIATSLATSWRSLGPTKIKMGFCRVLMEWGSRKETPVMAMLMSCSVAEQTPNQCVDSFAFL